MSLRRHIRPDLEIKAAVRARARRRPGASILSTLTVLALSGAAYADPVPDAPVDLVTQVSEVEFGVLFSADDSYGFGDYNGLEEEGLHVLGNLDLWGRERFDSGSARYWRLRAKNLGLDSRGVHLEYGEQGRYGLSFDYDQMPRFVNDSGFDFMGGDGGTYLALPAGWAGANTPQTLPNLGTSLVQSEVDHERTRYGGGLYLLPGEGWKLLARFDRHVKDGTKTTAGLIGISGGNPRSVLIPEPLDYVTDEMNVGLEFAGERGQFALGYRLSLFENRDESLTWEVPYTYPGVWDPAAEWPNGLGRKSLPPDNRFDQITFSGGYALNPLTRVTLNAAFGRMAQDEAFLPYTVNALTVTTPVPRGNLDGEILTSFLNLRVHSRLTDRLSLTAGYLFDNRDNNSPSDVYLYIPSDATSQGTVAESRARINHPYDSTRNELELDADYRLSKTSNLSFGYTMEHVQRSHEEVDWTLENAVQTKLRTRPRKNLTAGVEVGYSVRGADRYHFDEPFLTGHTPAYIATLSGVDLWENHPLLTRFHLADRDRARAAIFGTWLPSPALSLGLNLSYNDDDYGDTELGLKDRTEARIMLDLSWVPRDGVDTYAFYGLEYLRSDMDGWNFRGGGFKAADFVDPTRRWSQTTNDRVHTLGFGFKMQLMDRLALGADYLYARSDERNDLRVGSSLTDGSLPRVTTRLHNARVGIDYRIRENVTARLGYLFEKFKGNDFAYDLLVPGSLTQTVVTGEDVHDYANHLVTASLIYRFW